MRPSKAREMVGRASGEPRFLKQRAKFWRQSSFEDDL
jgi:hypothetical protein